MSEILSQIGSLIAATWEIVDWLFFLLALFIVVALLRSTWLFIRQSHYKKATEQTLYEIKIPREIEKGPKAMDQFFSGLHAFRNEPGSLYEEYIDGETTRSFSFELLGENGHIHLYMRVPRLYCDAIRSLLYAQYNDLEIVELEEDYLNRYPRSYDDLRKIGYEIYGMEAYLEKDDFYPLKTYTDTEERADERIIDPIAFFSEIVSGMPDDEKIMVQFVVKPASDKWQKKGEKAMLEMQEKRLYTEDPEGRKKRFIPETEHEKETAKAIQSKIAKDGFISIVRYLHVGPKSTFNEMFGFRSFFSYFNQLSTDSNRFAKNVKVWTRTNWFEFPYIFPKKRLLARSKLFYKNYLLRYFPEQTFVGKIFRSIIPWHFAFNQKTSILNTSELATLFHPPTNVVITTGLMDRVESKRIAPPSDLPN